MYANQEKMISYTYLESWQLTKALLNAGSNYKMMVIIVIWVSFAHLEQHNQVFILRLAFPFYKNIAVVGRTCRTS